MISSAVEGNRRSCASVLFQTVLTGGVERNSWRSAVVPQRNSRLHFRPRERLHWWKRNLRRRSGNGTKNFTRKTKTVESLYLITAEHFWFAHASSVCWNKCSKVRAVFWFVQFANVKNSACTKNGKRLDTQHTRVVLVADILNHWYAAGTKWNPDSIMGEGGGIQRTATFVEQCPPPRARAHTPFETSCEENWAEKLTPRKTIWIINTSGVSDRWSKLSFWRTSIHFLEGEKWKERKLTRAKVFQINIKKFKRVAQQTKTWVGFWPAEAVICNFEKYTQQFSHVFCFFTSLVSFDVEEMGRFSLAEPLACSFLLAFSCKKVSGCNRNVCQATLQPAQLAILNFCFPMRMCALTSWIFTLRQRVCTLFGDDFVRCRYW